MSAPKRHRPVAPDTSTLIALEKVGLVDVLDQLFTETLVTESVVRELKQRGPGFQPDPARYSWMKVVAVQVPPAVSARLDPHSGEASVVALALQRPDVIALLDEKKGRSVARSLNVRHAGAAGLPKLAKDMGRIPLVRPVLEAMIAPPKGLHISAELFAQLLSDAGED